jgi:hypothetical protein
MTKRDPAGVLLLTLITCGIYGLVWHVQTKEELNRRGAQIPTAWIWLIPFAIWYWLWKYAEGVELVSGGKHTAGGTFALCVIPVINFVAIPVLQGWFNQMP